MILTLLTVRLVISPSSIYELFSCVLGVAQNSPQLSTLTPVPVSTDSTTLKYQQQPGGDTLSDFVTLVCQEAQNAGAHSTQVGTLLALWNVECEHKNQVVLQVEMVIPFGSVTLLVSWYHDQRKRTLVLYADWVLFSWNWWHHRLGSLELWWEYIMSMSDVRVWLPIFETEIETRIRQVRQLC